MGIIRAKKLGYDYFQYEDEGKEPEITHAIEDVDLDIQPGQFIAVLGHNGSGKSTLAKHMNALLVPTEGTMWVDHMDTSSDDDIWKIRQEAGMVFQNPGGHRHGFLPEAFPQQAFRRAEAACCHCRRYGHAAEMYYSG